MPGSIAYTIPNLTTQGPQYAQLIDTALAAIQNHVHDGVSSGALIDIAAQECNEDLSLEAHNLSNVRSVELNSQPGQLTGSQDVNCLYVNQGNLGFNNDDGIFIPITNGSSLAPSADSNFLAWTQRTLITASFAVLYTDVYNFVPIDTAGGPITGTLPIAAQFVPPAASSASGRILVFKDVTGHAGTNPITIQVAPASGNTFGDTGSNTFQINNNFGYVAFYVDTTTSKWMIWDANVWKDQVIQLNGASTLQLNDSNALLNNGSQLVTDSSSVATFNGIAIFDGSTTHFEGGETVLVQDTSTVTFSGTSAQTMATGTSLTAQSGATVNLQSGSTTNASGQLNLGGSTALSGTVGGAATFSSVSVTGATLTLTASSAASTVSNAGTTAISGEVFSVTSLNPGTYTCDSGSYLDRYLALQLTASASFTINLPSSPALGRLITIADGNAQDPTAAPGYAVVINGVAGNIMHPGNLSFTYVAPASTLGISAPGTTYPANGVQGTGWAITLIWNGSLWGIYDCTPTLSEI